MKDKLLDFVGKLRDEGVLVSPAELIDALRSLCEVTLLDRSAVEAALEATLVKRESDVPVFRKLFNLFFLYGQTVGLDGALPGLDDFLKRLPLRSDEIERLRRILQNMAGQLSPMTQYLLSTDPRKLEILKGMLEELYGDFQELVQSPFLLTFRRPMKIKGYLFDDLRKIEDQMAAQGMSNEAIQAVSDELRNILMEMARKLEGAFPVDMHVKPERKVGEHYLLDRPFYNISETEAHEVEQILKNLSQYFCDVLSRKKYREDSGVLDVKRIIRSNIKHDLLPLEVFNRKRRYNQPDLVVICDISSSVRHAARFMLMFVHQLQRAFRRVRSFLFAGELAESTDLFKHHDITEAVHLALIGKVTNPHTYTDYGSALETFYREHLSQVRHTTVVVILGDGRNNYGPANDWVLQELRRRSRMIVWLNPENPLIWGTGDSLMPVYSHYCQISSECSTPRHLQKVMDRIAHVL